jgi:1-deoxy-D-xylulose-5-phosphate reductoisomerase
LLVGPEALEGVARAAQVDTAVAAIVGAAGLHSTWAALEAGKTVALANKETLVMAGPLVMRLAQRTGAKIVPVDSEHSAVFQCLQAGRREEVRRVILTASGGPFRNLSAEELARVTVEQALEHPTWDMGPKITIDSATMMNKALEIVEARWLFDAQMSPPDMKLPIQYAVYYPQRRPGISPRLDLSRSRRLDFEAPDPSRFPALELGLQAARRGGTMGAALNAANEEAVKGFLAGELDFAEIVPICQRTVERHSFVANPTMQQLLEVDRWARQEVTRWVCT